MNLKVGDFAIQWNNNQFKLIWRNENDLWFSAKDIPLCIWRIKSLKA